MSSVRFLGTHVPYEGIYLALVRRASWLSMICICDVDAQIGRRGIDFWNIEEEIWDVSK
ncbi:MAG: hypothetical protein ACETWE_12535 [Candidatus Bathyarchaeia archaeon]